MIGIHPCLSGFYLTDEDIAFICKSLNKNLIIIYEDHRENKIKYQALIYWEIDRLSICIFS